MRIWIDDDACPRTVREMIFRTATRREIPVTVVSNRPSQVPPGPLFNALLVPGGFDAADDRIATEVAAGDLVITSDIPLASRVIEAGALALSSYGMVFDPSNVGERLAQRNLMQELRSTGEVRGGPPPFGENDKKRFADALDRLVTKLMRPRPGA